MRFSRPALFALASVLSAAVLSPAAIMVDRAEAQENKPFDLKPLIPPVFPLPPSTEVTSGTLSGAPQTGPSNPPVSTTQTLNPPAPGLRLRSRLASGLGSA